jgi:hypothetical protein
MLFRRRLLRQLTSPRDRKYITSVVKRGDSWAGVAIYRAAKKAISSHFRTKAFMRESQGDEQI